MLQLQDLREMGETLSQARALCQQAQYDKGLALFQTAVARLQQFLRGMTKMSARQPWLQMQIELENEIGLITDYVELIQAFKVPPGQRQRLNGHPEAARRIGDEQEAQSWNVVTPESRKQMQMQMQMQAQQQENDPDVWAPPSPQHQVARGSPGIMGARAPPPWASSESNANKPNSRMGNAKPAAKAKAAAPSSDRRTPSDEQRKPRAVVECRKPAAKAGGSSNAGAASGKPARKDGDKPSGKSSSSVPPGPGEKPKYSDLAKEEGWADLELIEMIERDIVDNAPKITFDSIAGLEHTKQLLQEAVMLPQIAPHLFKDGLLKPCSGVLMFGPPGTGKTLLAKAVANVCNSTFFNVSASTLASKYRGESEKMVRVLFDMARYYSPAIVFMDEVDAIAGARGGAQEHESSRRVKTELLVQMNGVASGDPSDPSNRVMVLAATNLPWELDEAMRRRLTKRVYIPLPAEAGRRQLFKLNLERVDVAPDVDYDKLVAATEGYSGDDICGLCETAKMMPVKRLYTPEVLKELQRKKQEGASEDELKAHEKNALVVTWNDFQTALENVSKSVGQDQLERFSKWEEEFGSK